MTLPPSFFRSTLAAGLLLLGAKIGSAAVLTFEATGDAAAIQVQVDAFRARNLERLMHPALVRRRPARPVAGK